MDVNEQMSDECSNEGTLSQTIHNSFTRSHPSEEENPTTNRSKDWECKRAFRNGNSLSMFSCVKLSLI